MNRLKEEEQANAAKKNPVMPVVEKNPEDDRPKVDIREKVC